MHGVILQEGFVHDADALRQIKFLVKLGEVTGRDEAVASQIGRASCRERV